MPKLIINNLNIKEKNADKNGTTGYRVKIDGGNPIEFRKNIWKFKFQKGSMKLQYLGLDLKRL